MNVLNRRGLLASIIFCVFVFLISFFILNNFINRTMDENSEEQLMNANKQNIEIARVKIETVLDSKLDIFIENLLESGAIKDYKMDNKKVIELIKYFRKENFIKIMGIIVDNEEIFVNENDEVIAIDKSITYDILAQKKNIFRYTIDGQNYLIIKNSLNDDYEQHITTVYLYKDREENKDLHIPVYTEEGWSYIFDNDGTGIFYSTKDISQVNLDSGLERILSYSKNNLNQANKFKLDLLNKKSGIIKYQGPEGERWLAYEPIGFEDLYMCTIVTEDVLKANVDEIENLNITTTMVVIGDIILIFCFLKLVESIKTKEVNKLLSLDHVTGGNSYNKFEEELRKVYNKEIKAIYMAIDLDNFKIVNTVLGREYGDKVLKKIYEILKFHIGDEGCYCRKEADEFLAYYEYKDQDDIDYVVKSICKFIRYIRLPQNHTLIPSVGICYMNNKNTTIENLEVNAVTAKKKSKNKINEFYSYFEDSNLDELIDNKNILDDMNKALRNNEFRLVYQPKFDAKTKKVVGAEALIRWTKPDNTTVYPNEFIPVAEKTGFITFIDSYVFKTVCKNQAKWLSDGYNIVPISVNISREKLKDENFIYDYLKIIGNYGIEKEYVELEITEGDTYSYDNVKSNIVDKIKEVGFKVLIDDFGVGYSSLTMLKDIGADVLKLDRSFVIDESNNGKSMLKYIIKIAKLFNYKVLAEGVETESQYNFLKEDCDEIQGYYFSKPLEEKEFIEKHLKHL